MWCKYCIYFAKACGHAYNAAMRILGIDFGLKRVGLAISDESSTFALPHSVIAGDKKCIDVVLDLLKKEGITEIVVGESTKYDGTANTVMTHITPFVEELEKKSGIPVHLEPEFMTSVAASRFQGMNDLHDASAAALILQSFLDRRKNSA